MYSKVLIRPFQTLFHDNSRACNRSSNQEIIKNIQNLLKYEVGWRKKIILK